MLVSGVVKNDSAIIYVSNDCLDEKKCRFEWTLSDFHGNVEKKASKDIKAAANTSAIIEKLDLSEYVSEEPGQSTYRKDSYRKREKQYLALKLVSGDSVLSSNVLFFVPPKYWDLENPEIKQTIAIEKGRIRIDLRAQHFAPYVELGVKDSYARFSDNYFHLVPGETKTVFVVSSELPQRETKDRLFVRSLIDTYTGL